MAGFEVITYGRFWLIAEGEGPLLGLLFKVDQGSNRRSTHGFRPSLSVVPKAAIVPQAVAQLSLSCHDDFFPR
jgi:hypothetical protein